MSIARGTLSIRHRQPLVRLDVLITACTRSILLCQLIQSFPSHRRHIPIPQLHSLRLAQPKEHFRSHSKAAALARFVRFAVALLVHPCVQVNDYCKAASPPYGVTPSQTPDRFIPVRRLPNSSSDSFRLSTPVEMLTENERRSRHRRSGPDPFSRRLRSETGLVEGQRSFHIPHQQSMSRGASGTIGLRHGSLNSANRQVSAGAVWGAGGSAAATGITAVSDGRGNLLGSGTNAPLYTALFLSEPEPALETRAHERRLALALDVDQAGTVLGNLHEPEASASPSRSGQSNCSSSPRCSIGTAWSNNEWTQDTFDWRL